MVLVPSFPPPSNIYFPDRGTRHCWPKRIIWWIRINYYYFACAALCTRHKDHACLYYAWLATKI